MKVLPNFIFCLPYTLTKETVIEWCLELCRNDVVYHFEDDCFDCLGGVLPFHQLKQYQASVDHLYSLGKEEGSLFDTLFLTCLGYDVLTDKERIGHLEGSKVSVKDILEYEKSRD